MWYGYSDEQISNKEKINPFLYILLGILYFYNIPFLAFSFIFHELGFKFNRKTKLSFWELVILAIIASIISTGFYCLLNYIGYNGYERIE